MEVQGQSIDNNGVHGAIDRLCEAVERAEGRGFGSDTPAGFERIGYAASTVCGGRGAIVAISDPDGTLSIGGHAVSDELVRALGYGVAAASLEQLPAPSIEDVSADPDIGGTLLACMLENAGVHAIETIELECRRRNWRGRIVCLLDRKGRLDAGLRRLMRLIFNCILESLGQVQLSGELRRSESRLRAVLEGASDAILILDGENRVESGNTAAAAVFGVARGELRGIAMQELLVGTSEDPDAFAEEPALLRFLMLASDSLRECVGRRRDGCYLNLEVAIGGIAGEPGRTCIIRDTTLRKAVEDRVREADRLASIGTLAAGLGHDMNNMLFPIRAHVNGLEARAMSGNPAAVEQHFMQIRESLAYLQHLADSLHALALDPDGDGDGRTQTDLSAWWRRSGPLLSKSLHRRGQIECAISDDLPAVVVPPHALTRAVLNLLVNAVESMPCDREAALNRVAIRASVAKQGGAVLLEVADNGGGMSDSVRRRAFDMFFTTKPRGIGTGLGLQLVRRVVERAGGTIDIRSRVGMGTAVRLALPMAKAEDQREPLVAGLRIADGRVASIVRHLLDSNNARIDGVIELDEVDILVTDAERADLAAARRWMRVHPPERLVVLGRPARTDAAELEQLGVIIVPDVSDLESIERGIVAAIQNSEGAEFDE